ncbi:hypothetical protein O0881_05760 [Janthinobacterium sp. SUN100]|uniref:hypothetical protein n=1 Tax=Janthinobacterium sp. SUN100 TaxID=3004101 RepID=UPI0025B0D641|nr:hypothetical protein [Janthinobacterium sp. SUN100]MDN2701503.1 hypothetical protein [Janthinobacterium sp. SUN100]
MIEVLDFEAILATRKAHLVSLLPEAERAAVTALLKLESVPATKLREENAYQETILRDCVNEAGKAIMLAFALDGDLDQLGANVNVARLVITPANPNAMPPVAAVMEDNDAYRLRIQEAPPADLASSSTDSILWPHKIRPLSFSIATSYFRLMILRPLSHPNGNHRRASIWSQKKGMGEACFKKDRQRGIVATGEVFFFDSAQ